MNIVYIDIDSLRPDHLGCYGYHRKTSPNIDALASEGICFSNCYTPDAPCLPSRTAMTTGRFGIHTGVVNHGGVASQPHIWGRDRGFCCNLTEDNWVNNFRKAGYHTVAFSPFAQRHGAWHWYAGFMEMHNTGGGGMETADEISPQVCDWLDRKGETPFFMWVNFWDPHTPYRTPVDFEVSFREDPLPSWYTEDVRTEHWKKSGPHSPQEVIDYFPRPDWLFNQQNAYTEAFHHRQPLQIDSMEEARRMFDAYDIGVRYADFHVGKIIQRLKELGLYDNTAILISSDHGENLGELWVYGDHQTADNITHRVPMIVRWPGITDSWKGQTDDSLMYSLDMAATTLEWSGQEVPESWDGSSFAGKFKQGLSENSRDNLVLSQLAWCAQRSVRWEDYLYIETYDDAFHEYPGHMVFNLASDPHEQHNLADTHPDLVDKGRRLLREWHKDAMDHATHKIDPLVTVMAEGGSFHTRDAKAVYLERLRSTGRAESADRMASRHGPIVDYRSDI